MLPALWLEKKNGETERKRALDYLRMPKFSACTEPKLVLFSLFFRDLSFSSSFPSFFGYAVAIMAGNWSKVFKTLNNRQSGIFNKFDLSTRNPNQPKLSYVG